MKREEVIEKLNALAWVQGGPDREEMIEAISMAIESLSAEQKEEELAKDIARRMATIIENEEDMRVILKNASADRPSGEWKLASEELPQRVGSYIVTCKDEYGSVYVDYDFWTVLDEFKYNCSKVIAWIPFPKPYCGTKMKGEK